MAVSGHQDVVWIRVQIWRERRVLGTNRPEPESMTLA